MAENNMTNLKVFLRDDDTSEAKRFTVDASVVTSFIFMKEKLKTVFPNLQDTVFKITWKDSDGDEITIACDEDFIMAFTEMNGNVKVLYVTIQHKLEPTFPAEGEAEGHGAQYLGPNIICDICNQAVTGFRYKCMQCLDYDLCATCEHQGHHSEHLMMRVPNNDVYMPRCARKFMHHVARNLKKSAYAASKEAHRAAKFAHKFGQGSCGADQDKAEPTQSNCSTQQPQENSCPFTLGQGINLSDVHALGAMAREHFGPILEALKNAPPSSENNASNEGLFMNVIRNAVDGFFGKALSQDHNTQQESTQPSTTGTAPNSENVTPMDIEGAMANKETDVLKQKDKNDPGWTFVATPPQPLTTSTETSTPSKSSIPDFVYHENPKIAAGLIQLHEMGFSNESGILTVLLQRYEGNVNAVVRSLVEGNFK